MVLVVGAPATVKGPDRGQPGAKCGVNVNPQAYQDWPGAYMTGRKPFFRLLGRFIR